MSIHLEIFHGKALWPKKYQNPPPQRLFFFSGTMVCSPGFFGKNLDKVCFKFHLLVNWNSKTPAASPTPSCVLGLWNYERNLFCWIILSNLSCVLGEKGKNLSSSPVPYGTDNICPTQMPPKLESLLP